MMGALHGCHASKFNSCITWNHPFIPFIYSFWIFLSRHFKADTTQRCSDYSIDTVSELTRRSATGNYEWRTCLRSIHGGWSGIRTSDLPDTRHRTYHWASMTHHICNHTAFCQFENKTKMLCYVWPVDKVLGLFPRSDQLNDRIEELVAFRFLLLF